MRLGILGGTFNPPHNGHIILANEALRKLKLTKIIFIPCGIPPHKKLENHVSAEKRYKMTELAIKGNSKFTISRIEIDRRGPSYALETIAQIRQKYPQAKPLYYIIGSDTLAEIMTWKEPLKLFSIVDLAVVPRYGYPLKKALEIFKKSPLSRFQQKIKIVNIKVPGISSTKIRERIKKKKAIKNLMPLVIEKFIREKNLYQ